MLADTFELVATSRLEEFSAPVWTLVLGTAELPEDEDEEAVGRGAPKICQNIASTPFVCNEKIISPHAFFCQLLRDCQ
jgi:hypothetical protein